MDIRFFCGAGITLGTLRDPARISFLSRCFWDGKPEVAGSGSMEAVGNRKRLAWRLLVPLGNSLFVMFVLFADPIFLLRKIVCTYGFTRTMIKMTDTNDNAERAILPPMRFLRSLDGERLSVVMLSFV